MEGKAYVDDLTRDEMREYRGADAGKPSRPSPWRDRTPVSYTHLDVYKRQGAMSGLSIAVAGVLTAVLCPVFVNLIR